MSTKFEQKITLDLTVSKIQNVHCSQDDDFSRTLFITLSDNGKPYPIPQSDILCLKISKPDHTFVYMDETDETHLQKNTDGTVSVVLSQQMTSVPGICRAELQIISANGTITSCNFNIVVKKSVLSDAEISSTIESNIIQKMIRHLMDFMNPHSVTKNQVGLGNADNTADIDKNVNSAKKLTTARTINGAAFDGTKNIITDKWGKSRTLTLSGDVSASASLDGSSDIDLAVTVADDSHNHTVSSISDLTATATELNVLDGLTATTNDLNHTSGVTDNIQTQLNTKAPTEKSFLSRGIFNGDIDTLRGQGKAGSYWVQPASSHGTTSAAGSIPFGPDNYYDLHVFVKNTNDSTQMAVCYESNGRNDVRFRIYANGKWYPWCTRLGMSDISAIGDGSVTGAITELKETVENIDTASIIGKLNKSGDQMTGTLAMGNINMVDSPNIQWIDKNRNIWTGTENGAGDFYLYDATNKKAIIWSKANGDTNFYGNVTNADTVDGKHASELQDYNNLSNKPSIPAAVAVKGNAESSYHTGNVNITPANIGLGNVANERQYSASNPQPSVTGSSGSCTGNAATATALTTNAGSASQPVYFSSGKPVACTAYASASVNYANSAGTATTATKATQDGNGRNIVNTYFPKTGGTINGATTINSGEFLSKVNIKIDNAKWFITKNTAGIETRLLGMNSSNSIHMGDYNGANSSPVYLHAKGVDYDFLQTTFRANGDANATINIGDASHLWKNVYARTGTIQTSDRTKKHDIRAISEVYERLFLSLQPKSFMFDDGDRVHIGAISQDVEDAMEELGIAPEQFAGFCKDIRYEYTEFNEEDGTPVEASKVPCTDEDGNLIYDYALRYQEFIFLTIHMTQRLWEKTALLEKENLAIKDRVEALEKNVI